MYTKTIYLSGGDTVGLQQALNGLRGVLKTVRGLAELAGVSPASAPRAAAIATGGNSDKNVLTRQVLAVTYDPKKTDISTLLDAHFAIASPYLPDGQGTARGQEFRAGVYYTADSAEDLPQLEYYFYFLAARGKSAVDTGSALTLNDPNSRATARRICYAELCELVNFVPLEN